ncbi:hypothetical protein P154DRAFT_107859 [Amniculicola lignicola CBS 123094]|uniref:SWIM-type domain-containing protein n=1 Tax=Amniculicola lignicola CBS 123094 TaxID=1392246 RepID=A0A6A5WS18_9PLEO|nr:hypothetical protein P154DRAFT_107859 [Amniculicola lignicola CBS 123094]
MSSAHSLPTSRAFVTHLINSLPALGQLSSTGPPTNTTATPNNPLSNAPDAAKKQLLTLHVLFPNELLPALDLLDRHLVTRFRIREQPEHLTLNPTATPHAATVANPAIDLRGAHEGDDVAAEQSGNASAPYLRDDTHALAVGRGDVDVEIRDAGQSGIIDPSPAEGTDAPRISPEMEDSTQQQEQKLVEVAGDTVYYVRSAQQKSSRYNTSFDSTTSYEVRLEAWNCSCPAFAFAAFPSVSEEHALPALDNDVGLREVARQEDGWSFGGCTLGETMPPVCKHLLACVLAERGGIFSGFIEEKEVSIEEAAGWAAGWGD